MVAGGCSEGPSQNRLGCRDHGHIIGTGEAVICGVCLRSTFIREPAKIVSLRNMGYRPPSISISPPPVPVSGAIPGDLPTSAPAATAYRVRRRRVSPDGSHAVYSGSRKGCSCMKAQDISRLMHAIDVRAFAHPTDARTPEGEISLVPPPSASICARPRWQLVISHVGSRQERLSKSLATEVVN